MSPGFWTKRIKGAIDDSFEGRAVLIFSQISPTFRNEEEDEIKEDKRKIKRFARSVIVRGRRHAIFAANWDGHPSHIGILNANITTNRNGSRQ